MQSLFEFKDLFSTKDLLIFRGINKLLYFILVEWIYFFKHYSFLFELAYIILCLMQGL
jgi:hypothetical protein